MEYTKLPPIRLDKKLELEHFPSRFHAAVFRLWETVSCQKLAEALGTTADVIKNTAEEMGLPEQKYIDKWEKLGYITTIKNAWQILPYEQLLTLLGWNEEQLATVLKEDDFLYIKLGRFKPYCEPVKVTKLNDEQKLQLVNIKNIMKEHFSGMFAGAAPFEFFKENNIKMQAWGNDNLRMIYSYCGLYAGALDNDIDLSYPDKLLDMYRSVGVNAIWLPVILYQVVPFPFDESYSVGWEKRVERLKELISKADKYGIKVYLYLNEPRCMPTEFFDKYPQMKGRTTDMYSAMCTSTSEVLKYLRNSVYALCEMVPDIGGFFAITCSENLTHCKSKNEGEECERCKGAPISQLVAQVICAISEESRKVNPDIRTIAWTWAWDDFMTKEEIRECINLLPKEVIIQCNSEAQKEFTIGGIAGNISDYSMSIPGPAPLALDIWDYAKEKGHEVSAKVQVTTTWECSTLPFLPVFDLIREHMKGLKAANVEHMMLSWTLGGYPSINLKVATDCLVDSSEEKYEMLLKEEFGECAENVKKASKVFSDAFREFPFHVKSLYRGPQNGGPSNPLYLEPSGFESTMTGYAYDDIDSWRSIYPKDVYIKQFKKLRDGWKKGLEEIEQMPDSIFKQVAFGAYAVFNSSYLQTEFIDKRYKKDSELLSKIVKEEEEMALAMYKLMQKNSLFGYEASNHYYFNKTILAEKVINCEYVLVGLKNR